MPRAIEAGRIRAIHEVIRPHIRATPVVELDGGELGLPAFRLTLKLEQLQHSGSFKARGAFANLLTRELPAPGVVAASGGNHGAAVGFAAMRLGVSARIFVPSVSSPAKVERIRSYGAELSIVGERYAEALAASLDCAATTGALPVHAFDQEETLLGQGTLGLELSCQAPDLDTLLVAVGGGGLIGGIAAWYAGSVRVIGVEPQDAPTLTEALRAGRPVNAPTGSVAADSLAPRCVGELMFPIAQAHVDRVLLVSDAMILRAQRALWDGLRIVAEPGGATAFAALIGGVYGPTPGERVGVVVSGGNTLASGFGAATTA
ncbi:MAG TPA: threonine/serine dehydratase [Vicinamibacteria bacterium]|nr:threonine/serine dehydratase [Vicinamibacteria bacterium]